MICGWTCFIASMFIIANILFTFLMNKHSKVAKYEESLDEKQRTIYKNIVNERKNLALQGLWAGSRSQYWIPSWTPLPFETQEFVT